MYLDVSWIYVIIFLLASKDTKKTCIFFARRKLLEQAQEQPWK